MQRWGRESTVRQRGRKRSKENVNFISGMLFTFLKTDLNTFVINVFGSEGVSYMHSDINIPLDKAD